MGEVIQFIPKAERERIAEAIPIIDRSNADQVVTLNLVDFHANP